MKIALIPGAFFPVQGAQVQVHNLANKLIDNKLKLIVIYLIKQILQITSIKFLY